MTSVAIVRDDGHITTQEYGSPYVMGSVLAYPGAGMCPPAHHCEFCDFVRHALDDPLFAAEFHRACVKPLYGYG